MARSARGSARAPIKLWKSNSPIKIDTFSLFDHCLSLKTRRDTESWSLVENWKWKNRKFLKNFKKIQNLGCKKFHFQFFIKLQDSVSLRVFKLWQWSNNEKVSIFMGEFDFHNFIGARALPRTLRAMSDASKMSFWLLFKDYEAARAIR